MRNLRLSKVVYLLGSLGAEGRAAFRMYLDSPLFNAREEVVRLYALIEDRCMGDEVRELDEEEAIRVLWGDGNGSAARLSKVKNAILTLLGEYLDFRYWRESGSGVRLGMLNLLNDVGDESYFEQYHRKAVEELEAGQELNLGMLADRLAVEMEMMRHKRVFFRRSVDSHLDVAAAAMKRLVAGHVLRFAFLFANQRYIVGGDVPEWIAGQVRQLQRDDLAGEPLLETYYLLYLTHGEDARREDLEALRGLLERHLHRLEPHEAYDVTTGTLNNFARYARRTGENLLEPMFELYQMFVERLVRPSGLGMDRSHFKNVVSLGARLGRHEWVAGFLVTGREILKDDSPGTTLDYNAGVLNFYKLDYVAAQRSLHRVLADAKDVFYAYDARQYLLMCQYETEDLLGMEAMMHSFRMLLDRSDKVSAYHKQGYLAFLRILRQLVNIGPYETARWERLRIEVAEMEMSAGKAWLEGKVGR